MFSFDDPLHPADTLKTLDRVAIVDPRNEHIELAEWHSRIAEIELNHTVPKSVRQLFENAKNIALYAYFAYRLHEPSAATSYSALEQALKMKYEQEKNNITIKKAPKTLEHYMNIALDQGWITDEGYKSSCHIAACRVRDRKLSQMIKEGAFDDNDELHVPEPAEHEILDEMRSMGVAKKQLHAGRHVRNFLAHGDYGVSDMSVGTLANVAEEINQLFPPAEGCR